jgi:hypothetical protein
MIWFIQLDPLKTGRMVGLCFTALYFTVLYFGQLRERIILPGLEAARVLKTFVS